MNRLQMILRRSHGHVGRTTDLERSSRTSCSLAWTDDAWPLAVDRESFESTVSAVLLSIDRVAMNRCRVWAFSCCPCIELVGRNIDYNIGVVRIDLASLASSLEGSPSSSFVDRIRKHTDLLAKTAKVKKKREIIKITTTL